MEKIRLKLKAYDHRVLDRSVKAIVDAVKRTGSELRGPIPLPTKIKRYTVLRSPHVNKDSREQFEIRVHARLIDILSWCLILSVQSFQQTKDLISSRKTFCWR